MTENPQKCQKCGSPVTPGMKFCESCGAKIEAVPVKTESVTACPKCGAAIVPNMKSCSICGAMVAAPAAPPAPPAPENAPVAVTRPPVQPAMKTEEKTAPAPAPVQEPAVPKNAQGAVTETGPRKPASQTTLIIAGIVILALLAAAVFFVGLPMLSGSGNPVQSQQPQVPPGPGSSSGAAATTADASQVGTVSLTAGPTDVPPANRALIIDVERNAISHDIIVTFQGGEGQYGVRELAITLTRSDGTVETKSLGHLERGSSTTLKGTEKADRVEVTANFYNGETYKVVDKVFEYKKRVGSS
jgi:hypothetical protein